MDDGDDGEGGRAAGGNAGLESLEGTAVDSSSTSPRVFACSASTFKRRGSFDEHLRCRNALFRSTVAFAVLRHVLQPIPLSFLA